MKRLLLLILLAVIVNCSGAHEYESASENSQALNLPTALPVPFDVIAKTPLWDGTTVDLMVADAWAGCAGAATGPVPDADEIRDAVRTDPYLQYVAGHITKASCSSFNDLKENDPGYGNNVLRHWYKLRTQTSKCNAPPGGVTEATAKIDLVTMPGLLSLGSTDTSFASAEVQDADDIVRYAGVNLCIAERLRRIAPGAAGADALLLSGDEQRDLLNVTRERAQVAMLQYVLIGRILTATDTLANTALQKVRDWAEKRIYAADTSALGAHFLEAVQLHTIVSDDLAALLARSSSAHIARGGIPQKSAAAEDWDAGSWRSRMLQSLYGGDPLDRAEGGDLSPWFHFKPGLRFPVPYVDVQVRGPLLSQMLTLARRYDALELKYSGTLSPFGSDGVSDFRLCNNPDTEASASRLYRAIEAGLRTSKCTVQISGVCQPVTPEQVLSPGGDYSGYLAWTSRRLTLDDARDAVNFLSAITGRVCHDDFVNTDFEVQGSENVTGISSIVTHSLAPDVGTYYHIDKNAQFESWQLNQRERIYASGSHAATGLTGIILAPQVFLDADAASQGYVSNYAARTGSVSALIAVRQSLNWSADDMVLTPPSSSIQQFFLNRVNILDLIGAAAGTSSASFNNARTEVSLSSKPITDGLGHPTWHVEITAKSDDAFWQNASLTLNDYAGHWSDAFNTENRDIAQLLILHPDAQSFLGATIATLPPASSCSLVALTSVTDTDAKLTRFACDFVLGDKPYATHSMVVVRTDGGGITEYRALYSPPVLNTLNSGYYMGSGGTLNDRATRAMRTFDDSPSEPYYDGFDLSRRLVPSSDPLLAGNTQPGAALAKYLADARSSANSAVTAVTTAFTTLLSQEQSEVAASVQVAQSAQVILSEMGGLCGAAPICAGTNPAPNCCDTSVVAGVPMVVPLSEADNNYKQLATDCASAADLPHRQIACAVKSLIEPLVKAGTKSVTVEMSAPVLKVISNTAPPSFSDYTGGTLQGAFINEWAGMRHLRNQIHEIFTAYQAVESRLDDADAALSAATQNANNNCDAGAFAGALLECFSTSAGFPGGASVSFSAGPLIEQQKQCKAAQVALGPAAQGAVTSLVEAMNTVANEGLRLGDASADQQKSYASVRQLTHQTDLAVKKAQADQQLAALLVTSNQNIFRRYHSYDLWRAKALLESARRYAVIARRAIEARYVVELSTMKQAEPLVGSPSQWADSVYGYDLSMPSAVGLTIGGAQDSGSIYPNAIVDYVDNLGRFVDGFVVARPTAAVNKDTEVISLPGPLGLVLGPNLSKGVAFDTAAYQWQYFCPSTSTWTTIQSKCSDSTCTNLTGGDLSLLCSTGTPSTARLTFSLDPWGRVDDGVFDPPYTQRFNSRWNRLAVNLVGTGIRDCSKASDPMTCYTQAFIPFNLTHVGPSWVTNFEQSWRLLLVPRGQIEGGKALAGEEWLDPLGNGWGKPYVEAIARDEFADRPLGGGYQLDLQLGPEVNLARIERIQILTAYGYWVRQQ